MVKNLKVGIDMVYIPKFALKVKKRGKIFLVKAFSEREIIEAKGNIESLAGKYAGKEAFIKTLTSEKYSLKQIEVLKEKGKPYLLYKENKYEVSLSHAGSYTIAIVIA